MIDWGQHNILGVPISAVDYDAAVQKIVVAAQQRQPFSVSALAVHGVMTGVLDPQQRFRLNAFDLLVPDGQPVRWALRWLHGKKLPDRVYGPTLTLKVCAAAEAAQLPIFFYGSTPETLAGLRTNLTKQFPNLRIAGMRPSRFRKISDHERDEVAAEIRDSGAAITFVGLGCPRQEVWAYEFRELLPMPVLAVGAAFAFHAGTLPQAPSGMQRWGLEWLFRLVQEPLRLWQRYLLLNPLYLSLLACQATRIYTIRDPGQSPHESLRYG